MQTFLEYYRERIQPQIAVLDLFLKTEEAPYTRGAAAAALGISEEALAAEMEKRRLVYITRGVFLLLLREGETPLCRMLGRVLACGLPERYTAELTAYIFDLPQEAVRRAARRTGFSSWTEGELPILFSQIRLSETRYPQ